MLIFVRKRFFHYNRALIRYHRKQTPTVIHLLPPGSMIYACWLWWFGSKSKWKKRHNIRSYYKKTEALATIWTVDEDNGASAISCHTLSAQWCFCIVSRIRGYIHSAQILQMTCRRWMKMRTVPWKRCYNALILNWRLFNEVYSTL